MNIRALLAAASVASFLVAGQSARADVITYTGYTVLNDQNVTLTDASLGINEAGGAGQVTLTGTNTAGGTLNTWCVDIQDYLLGAGSFTTASVALSYTAAYDISALITNGTPLLGASFDASAALQVAIWEMEYGSDLTVGGSSSMLALAQTYVGKVNSGLWTADPNGQLAIAYGNGSNQTQAYQTSVPEPTSLALLATGLLCLGALTRRRSAPQS